MAVTMNDIEEAYKAWIDAHLTHLSARETLYKAYKKAGQSRWGFNYEEEREQETLSKAVKEFYKLIKICQEVDLPVE